MPGGERVFVDSSVFSGWSYAELERGAWKRYLPPVGPGDVRTYIETHDLRGPDCSGSGAECIPPVINEETGQRRFEPGQLRCPDCLEAPIHPIGWRYPVHKPKTKDPNPGPAV